MNDLESENNCINKESIANIFGGNIFLKNEDMYEGLDEGVYYIIDEDGYRHSFNHVLDENAKLLFVEEEVWDTIWLDDDENTPSSTTIETLGYMFEYNENGYSVKKAILDGYDDVRISFEKNMITMKKEASFDLEGKVLSVSEYDRRGNKVHTVEFDEIGRKKEETIVENKYEYLDPDDRDIPSDSLKTVYTYDEKGDIVDKKEYRYEAGDLVEKIEYFENSKKITTIDWSGWEGPDVNERIEPLEKTVHTPEEIAEGRNPDENGILSRNDKYYEDDDISYSDDGVVNTYCRDIYGGYYKRSYKNEKMISGELVDPDGNIVERVELEYDEKGNVIKEKLYDYGELSSTWEYQYNDIKNEIDKEGYLKVNALDSEDYEYYIAAEESGPIGATRGFLTKENSRTEYEYDKDGRVVHRTGYDENGILLFDQKYEYDDEGNIIGTFKKAIYTIEEIADSIRTTEKEINEVMQETIQEKTVEKEEQNKTVDDE